MNQSDAQIVIIGQDGADGEQGPTGNPGATGTDGAPGTCHTTTGCHKKLVCDCGTDGNNAGSGTAGGTGKNGTNGQPAPTVNIKYDTLTGNLQVWSQGGNGGAGGKGGSGGVGGNGGDGGSNEPQCVDNTNQQPQCNMTSGGHRRQRRPGWSRRQRRQRRQWGNGLCLLLLPGSGKHNRLDPGRHGRTGRCVWRWRRRRQWRRERGSRGAGPD